MCVFIYFLKIYVNLISILSCLDLFLMQSISEIIYRTFHSRLGCDCQSDIYSFSYFFFVFLFVLSQHLFSPTMRATAVTLFVVSSSLLVIVLCGTCATFWTTTSAWADSLALALNLQPYILPRWLVWPGLGWLGLRLANI